MGPIDHTLPPICASLCRYLSYLFHSLSVGGLSYKRSHLLSLYPLCILSFSLSLIPFSICVHLDLLIYQLSTNNASKCYLSYSPFLFHSLSRSRSLSVFYPAALFLKVKSFFYFCPISLSLSLSRCPTLSELLK